MPKVETRAVKNLSNNAPGDRVVNVMVDGTPTQWIVPKGTTEELPGPIIMDAPTQFLFDNGTLTTNGPQELPRLDSVTGERVLEGMDGGPTRSSKSGSGKKASGKRGRPKGGGSKAKARTVGVEAAKRPVGSEERNRSDKTGG